VKNTWTSILIGIALCVIALLNAIDANAQEQEVTEMRLVCLEFDDAKAIVDAKTDGKLEGASVIEKSMINQYKCSIRPVTFPKEISTDLMEYYKVGNGKIIGVVYVQKTNGLGGYLILSGTIKPKNKKSSPPLKCVNPCETAGLSPAVLLYFEVSTSKCVFKLLCHVYHLCWVCKFDFFFFKTLHKFKI